MPSISELEFMNANYSVKIIRLNEKFVLHNEELGLVTEAHDSIESAYEQLQKEQLSMFGRLQAIGKLKSLPTPETEKETTEYKKQLRPFLVKMAIFSLVSAFLISTAIIGINYTLQTTPRKLALKTGRTVIAAFIKELEDFTAGELTPEKEAQIRLLLRESVAKAKVYTSELAPLFGCNKTPN